MKLLQVIKNEFHRLTKGKYPLIGIIFAVPIMFVLLFGVVYHENVVENIPLVIYDQDQGTLSRSLIQAYTDSERFHVIAYVDSQEDMEDLISRGDAHVGLGIPNDFSKNTKKGISSTIILVTDSANNMFGNAALSAAQEINRTFTIGVGQKLIEATGQLPDAAMNMVYPLRFSIRIINNPTNGYTPFMLSGLMLNGLQIGLMLIVGPLIMIEFRRKQHELCYCRDYSTIIVMVGKFVPCWLTAMVAYGISIILMNVLFQVPVRGGILDLFILGAAFLFFVISALVLLGACSPTIVMSLQVPLLYIMPGLLFSGLSWPDFAMNNLAYFLSHLLPMTYAADNLRDLLLSGYAPRLFLDSFYMLILGLTFLTIGTFIMHIRRKYEPKKILIAFIHQKFHKREAV